MGLGWRNAYGTGKGDDTITSGLEGAWTPTPASWDTSFFDTLFGYEWELSASPAGASQWVPTDPAARSAVPDPHDPSKRHAPVMLTTDLALRLDPVYEPISRRFHENPEELADAFAKAWFKLTHRDMGPRSRYLGPLVPAEPQLWQDPVPAGLPRAGGRGRRRGASSRGSLPAGLSVSQLVSDRVGLGVDVPRHRQARRRERRAHPPRAAERLGRQRPGAPGGRCSTRWRRSRQEFAAPAPGGMRISLADLIVLGGCAAVEKAARDAGVDVEVPFAPGRTDATQEQTDVESFAVLEPTADGFRNYLGRRSAEACRASARRQGEPAHADRARDDGARGRPARAGRQPRPVPTSACSPTARRR